MKVKDAMHCGVEWVSPNAPLSELAKRMREHDIGALPVGHDDKLIGMVTDRDIVCRGLTNGKDISKLTARDVMTPSVVWCRSDEELDDATRIMESKRIRRLPVIDENKRMVGMLSLGDLSHARKSGDLPAEVLQAVSAHHN
ncbi:MAG TPA: CBS domain-containing protein [Hyphomicrobium sp.]|nr:CBS domain-containing protein [Hyphomicrobium sp.]